MPRRLPWETSTIRTTSISSPRTKRPAPSATPVQKRLKFGKKETATDAEDSPASTNRSGLVDSRERVPSSSPPPEPPPEIFMKAGLDHDDKYRMVEDEFLACAHKFTVHLHAAEYKRLQKMAKTRNAETINSIARPVIGKMTDNTKRKLDSVNRAKEQRKVLDGLLGKKTAAEMSDESEDDALPYVGTTLHGLMDSPRRKAASLSKLGMTKATTRAAAGFKEPSTFKSPQKPKSTLSPRPKKSVKSNRAHKSGNESMTESSADDDDLDAPIPAPKLIALKSEKKPESRPLPPPKQVPISKELHVRPVEPTTKPRKDHQLDQNQIKKSSPEPSHVSWGDVEEYKPSTSRSSRLERARLRIAREEKEKKSQKKLDIIPSFL